MGDNKANLGDTVRRMSFHFNFPHSTFHWLCQTTEEHKSVEEYAPVPSLLVVELPGDVSQVHGRIVLPLQERVEAVLRAQGTLLLLVEYGIHLPLKIALHIHSERIFSHLQSCTSDLLLFCQEKSHSLRR